MTLAGQLFKAGLLPEAKYRQHQAEEQLQSTQPVRRDRKAPSFVSCSDLDSCDTMAEFKQAAKEILEHDQSQISVVIQKAHRFKNDKDPATKKFIWFFYELRDRMRGLNSVDRNTLLRLAFRRHGATFELKK